MKFIVLTPSKDAENEEAIVSYMIKNGLPNLHVRKPGLSREDTIAYIEKYTDAEQSKMILHSYHQILLDYDLKGLHLSKRHKKKPFRTWYNKTLIELRMGQKITICTSSKSLSSMADNYKDLDYIMLTPVFVDPQGHKSSFSPALLQQVLRNYPDKIVARGGSSAESIEKARDMGFAGIAFHNFFWSNEDPRKEFDRIMDRFQKLGISIS